MITLSNRIGEPSADDREHAPHQAEDADQVTNRLIVKTETGRTAARPDTGRRHTWKERRDDPAVQSHQAEPEAEQRHGLPFVVGVPLLQISHVSLSFRG
jgi:hypothetical protein